MAISLLFSSPGLSFADEGEDYFEKKVRPVFAEHCYSCHSAMAKKSKGGLELDTPERLQRGGDSGVTFRANDLNSLLLLCVERSPDVPAMPPKGKLPDEAVASLRKWVMMGAPLPTAKIANPNVLANRDFWSFLPVAEHVTPRVSDPKWPRTKSDFFILKKLDENHFCTSPEADKRTLIRRLYYDLIGLPPTIEQVEAFNADSRKDAYEHLVDDLMASPRFGEKWARHWLDVARYAEDNSTSESTCKPPRFPYRYRDWVIEAFNANIPFDKFVKLQLAADLDSKSPPSDHAALGFLGLSPVYHKEPKLSKDVIAGIVADEWDERVDAITRGFLGLTVACARCHDHKFDPISTSDYYALAGVMANIQLVERPLDPNADAAATIAVKSDLFDATLRLGYAREMRGTAIKEKKDPSSFDQQIKTFEERIAELKKREKGLDSGAYVNAIRDAGTSINGENPDWTAIEYQPGVYRDLPIFIRGNPNRTGEIVTRRFVDVLSKKNPRLFREGSGRAELADAIVTDSASLTARVFVNRVWGWVFGRHLVTTPSNFGQLGDRPSHPELLDDLAARFIANGWSIKWLIRELVLSSTYRQSSLSDEKFAAADPDNQWLGRAPKKRLELEQWRDAMLQVSGRLNLAGGGPSDNLDGERSSRRTIYGKVSRERPADIHRLFDLPDPRGHGEKREITTTPLQQLYFLNSPFVRQSTTALVKKLSLTSPPEEGIQLLFRQVLLREASKVEVRTALQLIQPAREGAKPTWDLLAQSLLVSNEFLFLN